MIPRICCARPRNSLGRFTGFVVPQVREARAVVYKQRLLWWCVHGTLPGIILGRGNSLPICLWNQLPVTSSTCSPAERNGRRPSGLSGASGKSAVFFLGTGRGRQTSRPIFNLLYGPGVCLSAFFGELSNPGGGTGGLLEGETAAFAAGSSEFER